MSLNIILEGVVGSRAYGLDHSGSDTDTMGVFVADYHDILGLAGVSEAGRSYQSVNPDKSLHEVGRFLTTCLQGSLNFWELLYLDDYTTCTVAGTMLIDHRSELLSAPSVRRTCLGHVRGALKDVERYNFCLADAQSDVDRHDAERIVRKRALHALRVAYHGVELLETGGLTVRISADVCQELFDRAAGAVCEPHEFSKYISNYINILRDGKSVLPQFPNSSSVDALLVDVRLFERGF